MMPDTYALYVEGLNDLKDGTHRDGRGSSPRQRYSSVVDNKGMSLIEVFIVIAIVGILAALSTTSYRHFTDKAHTAEASIALAEVARLEELYQSHHGDIQMI